MIIPEFWEAMNVNQIDRWSWKLVRVLFLLNLISRNAFDSVNIIQARKLYDTMWRYKQDDV